MNLYPHQRKEVDLYGDHPRRGLLWCTRAGKSLAAIESAIRLRKIGLIKHVVITSPNGVHRNWILQELNHRFPADTIWCWDTNVSTSVQQQQIKGLSDSWRILSLPAHIWTMRRAQWLMKELYRNAYQTLLIVDESDDYSVNTAKRTRRVKTFARKCAAVRILTGTPWHDSLLHAWAQLEILAPGASGYRTYHDFSRRYGVWETRFGSHGSWPALVGYQHVDEFMTRVRKVCSFVTTADIPHMARAKTEVISIPLTIESDRGLISLFDTLTVETAGVVFGQIQQLVGLDQNRLRYTTTLSRQGRFVVIWCRYRAEIEQLQSLLPDALTWYGGTEESIRRRIRDTLRYDAPPGPGMVVIAQPQACARGLDFSRADLMIFHSHLPSVRLHEQALHRVLAIGSGTTTVYYICNSGIDEYILRRLSNKTRFARITLQDIMTIREYSVVSSDRRLRQLWKRPHKG